MKLIDISSQGQMSHFTLIYGTSGTGKTHLCSTLSKDSQVLFIDVDNGSATLGKLVRSGFTGTVKENIYITSFDAFEDFDTLYGLIARNKKDPNVWNKAFAIPVTHEKFVTKPFDFIVWDTWTELQTWIFEKRRGSEGVALMGDVKGKFVLRPNLRIQDWGAISDFNKRAITELRKLDTSQIFLMQEMLHTDTETGRETLTPAVQGAMAKMMPSYFDIVIRTYLSTKGEFRATTQGKHNFVAKDRRKDQMVYGGDTLTLQHILDVG